MFDLANFFATGNAPRVVAMTSSKSEDETASTSSVSSDSTPETTGSSASRRGVYKNRQANHKHKNKNKVLPKNNASTPFIMDYKDDEEEESPPIHVPPKIAFQMFELIELKRRCKGLYRRHQEKRRQSVIRANHSSYHSVASEFESFCIDGELFV